VGDADEWLREGGEGDRAGGVEKEGGGRHAGARWGVAKGAANGE